jgi:hypothetical protein
MQLAIRNEMVIVGTSLDHAIGRTWKMEKE